jgi:hypothetical protein
VEWWQRRRPWSKRGQHGRRRCSDTAADGWAPTVLDFFFQFIQNWLNFKNQNGCLILLQKFPILHAESRKYWEQLAQLCRLQIPNRNKVRNPVIDSVFESLMNFKRDSNLQENLINSPKFLLDLHKSEFS